MVYTLDGFCSAARSELRRDSGVGGRERVARHLKRLVVDVNFVRDYLGHDKQSGVETVYLDEEFGFRVMAHTNRSASNSTPLCHGPSWVIYGMAMNFVEMTEWIRRDDGSKDGYVNIFVDRKYILSEGEARVYNEGVIHSLHRPLETRLVRVTGGDLSKTLRYRYDLKNNVVKTLSADN